MSRGVSIEHVSFGYGDTTVLEDVSLDVQKGEFFAFLGPSGSGKTTLLRLVAGFGTPDKGRILIGERDVTGLKTYARAAAGLGYVPQTRDIFRSLTVEDNLFTGLKGRPRADLDEIYTMFPRLAERRNHGGMQLSGGEQQMLSLARTLLGKPTVLLLDDPLEGLAHAGHVVHTLSCVHDAHDPADGHDHA